MFKRLIFLYFSLLVLASCNQYKLADQASSDLNSYSMKNCQFVRNSSGQIVSWNSSVPIGFIMSDRIPAEWRPVIVEAAKVWVTPQGKQLIKIQEEYSTSTTAGSDKKNIIYWIDSGTLFNYQQAQTITRWLKDQLQDADILVNSRDFSFFDGIPPSSYKLHLKSLMVHEFGHALGLVHTKDTASVMYPELSYLQIRVDLSPIEMTSMNCEYL